MTSDTIGSMVVVDQKPEKEKTVDREKTCPLLLRVFYCTGRHNDLSEYGRGVVPSSELQMYTWTDATLNELSELVKEVNPDTRRKGTYIEFALISPNPMSAGYRMREIGVTCSGQQTPDDNKSLAQLRFVIGDYLDIAITPPQLAHRGMMRGPPMDRFSFRDDRMDHRMDRMDRMGPPMRRMRPY